MQSRELSNSGKHVTSTRSTTTRRYRNLIVSLLAYSIAGTSLIVHSFAVQASMHSGGQMLSMTSHGQVYVVNPGQTIEIQCDFETTEFDMFDNPVVWKKYQRQEESQINIMGNIFEPFLSTQRFEISFIINEPRYCLSLRISNSTADDSGNYTCEVRGRKSVVLASVTHYVFVRAPVQVLFLTTAVNQSQSLASDTNLVSAVKSSAPLPSLPHAPFNHPPTPERLTFIEGRSTVVRCVAVGGYPAPTLAVYLADRDITHQLTAGGAHLHTGNVLRGGRSGKPGLRTIITRVEIGPLQQRQQQWRVDGHHGNTLHEVEGGRQKVADDAAGGLVVTRVDDGQRLRCEATVPGLPSNVTETIIDVHYGPVINCDTSTAYLDEMNVYMRCVVRARPGVTSLFWVVDVNGTTLSNGEVTNQYWAVVTDRSDAGLIETRLHMHRATRDSFRSYHVVAENAVSVRTQNVRLIRRYLSTSTSASALPSAVRPVTTASHRLAVTQGQQTQNGRRVGQFGKISALQSNCGTVTHSIRTLLLCTALVVTSSSAVSTFVFV